MDTTPEYIKMCEKAKEIQKVWEPKDGDAAVVYLAYDKAHIVAFSDEHNLRGWKQDSRTAWLPRQDQLQEMFDGAYELCRNDLGQYQYDPIGEEEWFSTGMQPSAEIALLMGVMLKKHDKLWNGKKWAKF